MIRRQILAFLNSGKQLCIATENKDSPVTYFRKSGSQAGVFYANSKTVGEQEILNLLEEPLKKCQEPQSAADYCNLGTCHKHGIGVANDLGLAVENWRKSQHVHAQYELCFYAVARWKNDEAIEHYKTAASGAHPDLGSLAKLLKGYGINIDEIQLVKTTKLNHSLSLEDRWELARNDVQMFNAISAISQQEQDELEPYFELAPIPTAIREGDEEPGISNFGGIEIAYSETIGGEHRNYQIQQDAFLIGEMKEEAAISLEEACSHFDEKLNETFGNNSNHVVDGGTTGIIAHLSTDQRLTIANIGDSRAVLCIKKIDGSFELIRLTNDHDPNNEEERLRIEREGGEVTLDGRCHRVNSGLSLSRSFGDHDQRGVDHTPDHYFYDVIQLLRKYGAEECYLLLSCDGLYNAKGAKESSYARALEKWFKNEDDLQENFRGNVAYYLQECAINAGTDDIRKRSHDNITTIFCKISDAPDTDLLFGVFDGHRGYQNHPSCVNGHDFSGLAADFFADRFLSGERVVRSSVSRSPFISLASLSSSSLSSPTAINFSKSSGLDLDDGGIEF